MGKQWQLVLFHSTLMVGNTANLSVLSWHGNLFSAADILPTEADGISQERRMEHFKIDIPFPGLIYVCILLKDGLQCPYPLGDIGFENVYCCFLVSFCSLFSCTLYFYLQNIFKNVNCVYVWRGYITCIWVLVVHVPLEAKRCDISRARVCELSEWPLGNLAWAFWQAQSMLSCWAIPQALEFFINFVYVPIGVRGQLVSFLSTSVLGPSSSHWAWQQLPLPSKPS